jgi:hypothetical protein
MPSFESAYVCQCADSRFIGLIVAIAPPNALRQESPIFIGWSVGFLAGAYPCGG